MDKDAMRRAWAKEQIAKLQEKREEIDRRIRSLKGALSILDEADEALCVVPESGKTEEGKG